MKGNQTQDWIYVECWKAARKPVVFLYAKVPKVDLQASGMTCERSWSDRIFKSDVTFKQGALFEERDVGMLMALVTLLLGVVSRSYEGFESLVPRVVNLLSRLVKKDVGADYHYYGIPSPWLQVSIFKYCNAAWYNHSSQCSYWLWLRALLETA